MIRLSLLAALRSLKKDRLFSFINITGLALSFVIFFQVFQFIAYESSYEQFNPKRESVFRVTHRMMSGSETLVDAATTYLPVAPMLMEAIPEIEDYARVFYLDRHALIKNEESMFEQESIVYADPSFFDILGFHVLYGSPEDDLDQPNHAYLSTSTARRLYGEENAIGRYFTVSEEYYQFDFLVVGIFEDTPANSHIHPEVVLSLKTYENDPLVVENKWVWPLYLTYIRINGATDPHELKSQINEIATQHLNRQEGVKDELNIQRLEDIHLYSDLEFEFAENGSIKILYILAGISLFVFAICLVNFININSIRYLEKTKDIGVRKVLGSTFFQFGQQFLIDNALTFGIASLLAIVAFSLASPFFLGYLNLDIKLDIFTLPRFWIIFIFLLVTAVILVTLFPSGLVKRLSIANSLKGQILSSGRSGWTRKALMMVQFSITLCLMSGILLVQKQLSEMSDADLGFDLHDLLVLKAPRFTGENALSIQESFLQEVSILTGSVTASATSSVPSVWMSYNQNVKNPENSESIESTFHIINTDKNYLSTLGVSIIDGRNFSDNDKNKVIVSETAAKTLGFTDMDGVVGGRLLINGNTYEVKATVADYHHFSLHRSYEPVLYLHQRQLAEYYLIRTESNLDFETYKSNLSDTWNQFYPKNPLEYFFLEDTYNKQYAKDLAMKKFILLFTIISFFIAGMGIFGLSFYLINHRKKEIAVRKVLGADIQTLFGLLVKDSVILIGFAILVSLPVIYFQSQWWLRDFSYQTQLAWWIFLVPIIILTFLVFVITIWNTYRANTEHPVIALKPE